MSLLTSVELYAFVNGFLLGGGLIIAIGAQNAYLIRQGVRGQHVFFIATICFISDALLIVFGAAGIGAVIATNALLQSIAAWGGGAFLIVYGFKSAYGVIKPEPMDWGTEDNSRASMWKIALTTAALTYLNPHVYLDTVVLVGGVAAQYNPQERMFFTCGAIAASFVWFYSLAIGAIQAARLFRMKRGAQVLDAIVCLVMWLVAASLIKGEMGW